MPRKVEISHRTIVFTVVFLLSLWVLYYIRDIIFELFVALLIMTTLNPLVTRLSKYKIPRALSVFISYLLVFGILFVAFAGITPPLIEQTTSFLTNLPKYLSSLGISAFMSEQIESQLLSQLTSLPGQVISVSLSIVSNLLSIIFVLIFAFYLLLTRDKLDEQLSFFVGEEKQREIARMIDLFEIRLGGWARGELLLMTTIGAANYIGLTLLGVPYSLSLGILAGVLEIVPYFGPIIAGAIAILIGLSISPVMALAVFALAFLIQQVENYVFVPKIMEKSVGVNPIVTLLALTIGFRLVGIVGALISVPVVISLQVLLKEYLLSKETSS